MGYNAFSAKALASLIKAGDSQRFGIDLQRDRDRLIEAAVQRAAEVDQLLATFSPFEIKGKACVSYTDFADNLILRAIVRHLKARLNVNMPNRNKIVRCTIESLADATPIFIYRRDITSFYESVPFPTIRDFLSRDSATPLKMRNFISAYFALHCASRDVGIPRGVGISPILARAYNEGI